MKSRWRFLRYQALLFGYTAVWAVALIIALTLVEGWWRPLIALGFLLLIPPGADLTESYSKYKQDWQRANELSTDAQAGAS